MMNRRDFIKAMAMSGCAIGLGGITQLVRAAEPGSAGPLLTVVFLRGGADGLQMVAPVGDADYLASRPPAMRIGNYAEQTPLMLSGSPDPGLGFSMHAAGAPLFDQYRAGRLAVIHAVGLTDATRSHFVAERLIEAGLSEEIQINNGAREGWVTRSTKGVTGAWGPGGEKGKAGPVAGYTTSAGLPFAMHGMTDVLAAPDLLGSLSIPSGRPAADFLEKAAMLDDSPAARATANTLSILQSIDRRQPRDSAGRIVAMGTDTSVSYSGAGDLGRSLPAVARLAAMDVGLRVACVDFGGWDTHENQSGRVNSLFRQLATGLASFQEDLARRQISSTTVVMTEFGRRVRANKSDGTDHGHGACWFVLGDRVNGGRMVGAWPGLSAAKLDQGVDLRVMTDYRQVLAEVLTSSRLDASAAMRGYTKTGLGLMQSA